MTQAQLAERTKIHPRTISYYANNVKRMNVDSMRAISQVLDCHMEDLYEWND
jgi:transcriptional regulator with XRE-family HTH domain